MVSSPPDGEAVGADGRSLILYVKVHTVPASPLIFATALIVKVLPGVPLMVTTVPLIPESAGEEPSVV